MKSNYFKIALVATMLLLAANFSSRAQAVFYNYSCDRATVSPSNVTQQFIAPFNGYITNIGVGIVTYCTYNFTTIAISSDSHAENYGTMFLMHNCNYSTCQDGNNMSYTSLPGQGFPVLAGEHIAITFYNSNASSMHYEGGILRMYITGTCVAPTTPTLSASSTSHCGAQSTTLSIASGSLNSASRWDWYEGSCGGTYVGSGTSISVSPAVTTTYYARAGGGCTEGGCGSITINVATPPDASVSGSSVCYGGTGYVHFQCSNSYGPFDIILGGYWHYGLSNNENINVGTMYSSDNFTLQQVNDNGAGCISYPNTNATVSVNAPQATIHSIGALCPGAAGVVVFSLTSGTGPFSATINGSTYSNLSGGSHITVGNNMQNSTIYTLTNLYDAGTGCSTQPYTTTTVIVDRPYGLISGTYNACQGSPGYVYFHSPEGNGPFNVIINFNSYYNVPNNSYIMVNSNMQSTTTYTMTYCQSGYSFCSDYTQSSATVTVTPTTTTSVASSVNPINMCAGHNTTMLANTPTNGTGAWSIISGPNTSTNQLSNTGDPHSIFSPTQVGTYVLRWTISNSPCSASYSDVTVNNNSTPIVSSNINSGIVCKGGTAVVQINAYNGHTPYSGIGTFSRTAGTYSYTVSDVFGCSASSNYTIIEPTLLVASSVQNSSIICNGYSALINVSATGGATPYSGTFSGYRTAGSYTFTVTDGLGCTKTTSLTLTEPSVVQFSTVVANPTPCTSNNGRITATVTGGNVGLYQFSIDNGSIFSSTNTFLHLTSGTYTMQVKDSRNCTSAKANVRVGCLARLDGGVDEEISSTFNIYPNPANDHLTIDFSSDNAENYSLHLMDMIGQTIISDNKTSVVGDNQIQLNLNGLAKGIYLLNIQKGDANMIKKIIVQ